MYGPPGCPPGDEVISRRPAARHVGQIDVATEKVIAAIDGLDELDPASQDVVIEIRRGLDMDRWFLVSHIAVKQRWRADGPGCRMPL